MKYYIIAGEPSGDLHGSNLINGLLCVDPSAEIRFWGGDLMSAAAAEQGTLVRHYREESVMGFWEVLKNLRRITRSMNFCKADIRSFAPDALILIDYPGFNLRMAAYAQTLGIKTIYYIAPKVWAWKEHRVKKIKAHVDRLFAIFPFEVEYFGRFGIDTYYGGNPLMDTIAAQEAAPFADYCARNGLSGAPVIGLVAGSRCHEISFNLPVMIEVARAMPDFQFVVTGVDWLDKSLYQKIIGDTPNVKLVIGQTPETLRQSTAALVTSGTATLETALYHTPQVVCFKGPGLTMWIAKQLVKIKWISLVNIVMQRTVVTELIQKQFTKENALRELQAILPGGDQANRIKQDYHQLADAIGASGASERVAAEMYRYITQEKAK